MRKIVLTLCLCTLSTLVIAQTKKAKDTIKTEVINVVTSYTPTISDAFKIKKNPKIQLGAKRQKKQLKYQIFSAPVASTFIPKSEAIALSCSHALCARPRSVFVIKKVNPAIRAMVSRTIKI